MHFRNVLSHVTSDSSKIFYLSVKEKNTITSCVYSAYEFDGDCAGVSFIKIISFPYR